jgi:hypothetical protein
MLTINVGGKIIKTRKSTLAKFKHFNEMLKEPVQNELFFDCDPEIFEPVLNVLRGVSSDIPDRCVKYAKTIGLLTEESGKHESITVNEGYKKHECTYTNRSKLPIYIRGALFNFDTLCSFFQEFKIGDEKYSHKHFAKNNKGTREYVKLNIILQPDSSISIGCKVEHWEVMRL